MIFVPIIVAAAISIYHDQGWRGLAIAVYIIMAFVLILIGATYTL